ncbi:MAG: ATP-dependent sacrificial sulfur transferase LarE [Proteobacteria bacterium]|nr:ATP-dependent sacrificial sulfur transferase LarE [Desulfobulbaceae bacterium]MBU4153593.1 ATP-dependent sacrificial sulfur transferase LarE [Pseudomonadota bacterium]MDP2105417.1 ATP-dependent sacrificial sulfur transferase LarE [Desulfobulbaceae bacterium]
MNIPPEIEQKFQRLKETLSHYSRVAIAFSGGVDSSLLLKVAHDTLGDNTLALFADSAVQPIEERQSALDTAKAIGAPIQVIAFDPLAIPEFANNESRRCYYCKKYIFSVFTNLARQQNFSIMIDGTNLDDLSTDRPGMQAVIELKVQSPLAEAGLTKREIRILSRALDLPTWNKPSASCLATRITTDTPITLERLSLIEQAERYLHELDYHGCRVRFNGIAFTIELASGDIFTITHKNQLAQIRDFLFSLGAKKVFLDLSERESILS